MALPSRTLCAYPLSPDVSTASPCRRRSWAERLYLEKSAAVGFDRRHCEAAGFKFHFAADRSALQGVSLGGMGPKLLLSDASTASHPVLRWQLRVRGNTAVEFGVVPVALEVRRGGRARHQGQLLASSKVYLGSRQPASSCVLCSSGSQ